MENRKKYEEKYNSFTVAEAILKIIIKKIIRIK
jgi:hypothetical protein